LAFGASGALAAGCSSEPIRDGSVEQVGSLGFNLEAHRGDAEFGHLHISGNGFSKTGTIDTSGSPTLSGTIGGIPAASGYTITLTATSLDAGQSFVGSATFNVVARKTTSVTTPPAGLRHERQRQRVGDRHFSTQVQCSIS